MNFEWPVLHCGDPDTVYFRVPVHPWVRAELGVWIDADDSFVEGTRRTMPRQVSKQTN